MMAYTSSTHYDGIYTTYGQDLFGVQLREGFAGVTSTVRKNDGQSETIARHPQHRAFKYILMYVIVDVYMDDIC